MALTEVGNEGALTGTTPVTVLAAPASGHRRQLLKVGVYNGDGSTVNLTIQKDKAGTNRVLKKVAITTLQQFSFTDLVILDATDESIELFIDESPSTQPTFDVAAVDVTD
jgi:hypothetical protein